MKSEVTKILKDQLMTDGYGGHHLSDTKIETSKPEEKFDNHAINQNLPTDKAGVNDVKCETRNLEKGETNETINVNDGNQSEVETSNKIKEAKEVSTRPEEENEKGEAIKGEEDETEDQEHLEERVKDMTELGDIRSLDIAMAIAAGEILEFEKFNATEDNEKVTYEELDEDFEQKKKMIEEEP